MLEHQLDEIQVDAYATLVSATMYLVSHSINIDAINILREKRMEVAIEANISSIIISSVYKSTENKYQQEKQLQLY
jgi:hypothetical protein